MRGTIARALVFAVALTATSLAVDLLVVAISHGGLPPGGARPFLVSRSALHGATLVLSAAGALAGFALLRSYTISSARIATLAAFLGVVTPAALLVAFRLGGFWGMALWLVLSSALASYAGGRALASRPSSAGAAEA